MLLLWKKNTAMELSYVKKESQDELFIWDYFDAALLHKNPKLTRIYYLTLLIGAGLILDDYVSKKTKALNASC